MPQPGYPTPAFSVTSAYVPSPLFLHNSLRAPRGSPAVATVGAFTR